VARNEVNGNATTPGLGCEPRASYLGPGLRQYSRDVYAG